MLKYKMLITAYIQLYLRLDWSAIIDHFSGYNKMVETEYSQRYTSTFAMNKRGNWLGKTHIGVDTNDII